MSITRVRTRSHVSRRRWRTAVATALVATTAMSGCGLTDEGVRPGMAARVGDTTIELETLDAASEDLCAMYDSLAEQGVEQPVSRGWTRDTALAMLVMREIGEQIGEDRGISVSNRFRQQRQRVENSLSRSGINDAVLEDVLPLASSFVYFLDILEQLGDEAGAGNSREQALQAGMKVVRDWVAEQGLEVNPKFEKIEFTDDEQLLRQERHDLSVAVSDFAKSARDYSAQSRPDPAYAESLPESQRCG